MVDCEACLRRHAEMESLSDVLNWGVIIWIKINTTPNMSATSFTHFFQWLQAVKDTSIIGMHCSNVWVIWR